MFITFSAYLPIDIKTKDCGAEFEIADENEYIIKGTGDFTGTNCSYTFRGEVRDNCYGLCYDMSRGSFINNNETTLTLKTKTSTNVGCPIYIVSFNHNIMRIRQTKETLSNYGTSS